MTAQPARISSDTRTLEIEVWELTAEAFGPYGEISHPAAPVRFDVDGGRLSVCHVALEPRPFDLTFLGRHVRSTQTYAPLGPGASILVVAPPSDLADSRALPDLTRVAAFRLDGTCAVTIARGAWHRAPMPVGGPVQFVVLDREGTLDDLDLVDVRLNLGTELKIRP
jgi:ureidoglycolate lyase